MFHEKTKHAARSKWKGILGEFGVDRAALTGKHCACPICGGTDRFRYDNLDGDGTWICNQCGAGDGMALAMKITGKDFAAVAAEIDAMLGNVSFEAEKPKAAMSDDEMRAVLRRVASQTVKMAQGDLADIYLCSRHIGEVHYPKALRFARALSDGEGGIRPAMVATVSTYDGTNVSLHRTYLRSDGKGKAEMETPKKGLGPQPDGCAVRLCDDWHGGPLGIAEGIETALSASAHFDMPVWAALDAGNLSKWIPPEGCTEVAVFGDNDANYAGQRAAYTLGHRLATGKAPLPVTIHIPPTTGEDWADVWARSRA
jgi:putative DNA primase/helicase